MKQKQKTYTSILIASILAMGMVLFVSFRTTALLPFEYVEWIDNPRNEINVTSQINDFHFNFQYLPHEYLALRQLKQTRISKKQLQSELERMDDLQYYKFQMKANNINNLMKHKLEKSSFVERTNYYAFKMQSDIQLVDGKDSLSCVLFHHEQNFGVSPYQTFLLAFKKNTSNSITDKRLVFNEKIFGNGIINLTINQDAISSIPKLKTN